MGWSCLLVREKQEPGPIYDFRRLIGKNRAIMICFQANLHALRCGDDGLFRVEQASFLALAELARMIYQEFLQRSFLREHRGKRRIQQDTPAGSSRTTATTVLWVAI